MEWQDSKEIKWAHKAWKGTFLIENSLQAKCNVSEQINCSKKKITKTMNQFMKPKRTKTHLEKVFNSCINMSHLGLTMMKNGA